MSTEKSTIITAKVTKAQGYDLATKYESRKGCLNSPELTRYIGKILKIQILEVLEQRPAQDAEITVKVPVNQAVA